MVKTRLGKTFKNNYTDVDKKCISTFLKTLKFYSELQDLTAYLTKCTCA